jgi:hypothetical protein
MKSNVIFFDEYNFISDRFWNEYLNENQWLKNWKEKKVKEGSENLVPIGADCKLILKNVIDNGTIGNWTVKDEYCSEDYIKRSIEFDYYINLNQIPRKEIIDFSSWEKENKTQKEEKTETMNNCEFELGDVFVYKNELDNINDAKVIIICPNYNKNDFLVNDGNGYINVIVDAGICEDCGEPETYEFNFVLNPCYKVKNKEWNVRDGLFILEVEYDTESNVKLNDNL